LIAVSAGTNATFGNLQAEANAANQNLVNPIEADRIKNDLIQLQE